MINNASKEVGRASKEASRSSKEAENGRGRRKMGVEGKGEETPLLLRKLEAHNKGEFSWREKRAFATKIQYQKELNHNGKKK